MNGGFGGISYDIGAKSRFLTICECVADPLIVNLPWCDHDKIGRIIVNNYLEVHKYPGVFALGDCASVIDYHTGKPCPPTAQHAIREGKVAAKNLVSLIKSQKKLEG